MKRLFLVLALAAVPMLASLSEAHQSMMDDVNAVCGTNYNSCGLCHVDPRGGGSLNSGGNGYAASGACSFCPTDADCGGGGGCQPRKERCNDGKDNDCDGLIDCADPNCSRNRACR